MLKKLLRFFCISGLLIFISCAPRVAPLPPQIIEDDLSLEEIIARAGSDIEVLKAITDVKIEKNKEPYSFINASLLIRRPDQVHMRMYQLGMLVRDFVIKDDKLYVLAGKKDSNLKKLGRELNNAIFWWESAVNGALYREGREYIVEVENKKIHLDSTTLLPVKQEVSSLHNRIIIEYKDPQDYNGFWYPSTIKIFAGDFEFTVKLKKLIQNPPLGEFDFTVPEE